MSSLFSRIVVAVDDSEPSQQAIAFAIRLAAQEKGRLTAVNGVDWAAAVSTLEAGLSATDPSPIVDALRTEGRALLAKACAQAKAAGVECEERLVEDKPAAAILTAARDADALVIVMGTHGRSGLGRVLLGSVTEAVVRTGEIPVLAVHPTYEIAPALKPLLQNVLVAIDGEPPSEAAVHVSVTLLPRDGHRLTFCTVEEQQNEPSQAKAQLTLDRALEYAREYKVNAESVLAHGKPTAAIIAEAEKRGADLIVLGTQGRQGLERLFTGSVAEAILHASKVPVLIVHA